MEPTADPFRAPLNGTTQRVPQVRSLLEAHEAISAYKFPSLTARLVNKFSLSATQAQNVFEDLKQFLVLCAGTSRSISPPYHLDLCWHEFILYTEEYAAFCERFFGKFIHHRPHNDPRNIMRLDRGGEARQTIDIALELFGADVPQDWPFHNLPDEHLIKILLSSAEGRELFVDLLTCGCQSKLFLSSPADYVSARRVYLDTLQISQLSFYVLFHGPGRPEPGAETLAKNILIEELERVNIP